MSYTTINVILNRNYYDLIGGYVIMATWTIIGGGIQAVTIAIKLRSQGLSPHKLRIIDPNRNLCQQFNQFTQRIAMPYLRSPGVHHTHPNPFHLKQFAKKCQYTNASYGPYQRPNLEMFMNHTHELIHQYHLNHSHIQSSVCNIKQLDQLWHIQLADQSWISTTHLIIAFGCNHNTYTPALFKDEADVSHIFDDDDKNYDHTSHVVGSGITAAHLTLRLLKINSEKVIHLWTNKPLEVHDFDADPGWLGPKNMNKFRKIHSSEERLKIIKQERHKGSIPKEIELRLKKYVEQKRLVIHTNELVEVQHHHICTHRYCLYYDQILLATGFQDAIMAQPIIKQLINKHQAPVADCGLPSINNNLEWLPNLFVSGGLSDLELGPFARNIMGGREAAIRISQAFNNIENEAITKKAL